MVCGVAGEGWARGMDRRCGPDSRQLCAQAEDRQARRRAHSETTDRGAFSSVMGSGCGGARSAAVVGSSAQTGGDSGAGQEWVTASGDESRHAEEGQTVERGWTEGVWRTSTGRLGGVPERGSAAVAGGARRPDWQTGWSGAAGGRRQRAGAVADDATRRRTDYL